MKSTDTADYLRILHERGDVFEIRAPRCPERTGGKFTPTASGYFNDIAAAAAEVERLGRLQPPGIYVTLNPVEPDLIARSVNRVKAKAMATTDDASIVRRRWLLLDIDPMCPADMSATDAEMEAAMDLEHTIRTTLEGEGWPEALRMMSGNGCYLLYRIDLPNDEDSTDLIKRAINGLADRFDSDEVKVDRSTFNASRIVKIGGTIARKGDDTRGIEGIDDRPHRQAHFFKPAGALECVTVGQLEAVATKPDKVNGKAFDRQKQSESRQSGSASNFDRCIAYMDKMPDAISGQGGHNRTLQAACECYRFGLTDSEAWRVMDYWNEHKCGGDKWTDTELDHKLADAKAKVTADGEVGIRLRDDDDTGSVLDRIVCGGPPSTADSGERPVVLLPGGSIEVGQAARQLGALMAESGRYFNRGGTVVRVVKGESGAPKLEQIKTAGLCSEFETVAKLKKRAENKQTGTVKEVAAICSESAARQIQSAPAFIDALPPIHTVSPCPVLIERNGKLVTVTNYDRESGVLVTGGDVDDVSVEEARDLLSALLADFKFATPADRARALAALVTPALIMGGLLGDRAPLDLGEADASQTGKGYRNKITAAVYGQHVRVVTQQRGHGVGSLEESIGACLISGAGFVSIDNVRGKLDSPALEALLTEDDFTARAPYHRTVSVKPARVVLMMTSNRAELTEDLANRASIVRLLKQADNYTYADHPEGDLLAHVRANRARYLGAVFAIVRAWHSRGKQTDTELAKQHDRRRWAGVLGWIVGHLLNAGDLLDGHRQTQARTADAASSWLRDVMLVVKREGRLGDELHATNLLDLLHDDGDVDIPGWSEERSIEVDHDRRFGMRGIGTRMGRLFKQTDTLDADGLTVTRTNYDDDGGRPRHTYRVSESIPEQESNPPKSPQVETPPKTKLTGHSPNTPKTDSYSLLENSPSLTRENNDLSSGTCEEARGSGYTPILDAILRAGSHGVSTTQLATDLSMDVGEVVCEVQYLLAESLVVVNRNQRVVATASARGLGWAATSPN